MRARVVLASLGAILSLAAAAFLVPATAGWFREAHDYPVFGFWVPFSTFVFFACFAATFLAGGALQVLGGKLRDLRDIEGYAVVSLGWLVVPLVFSVPFRVLAFPDWPSALFESMSGVTTTGFTVAPNVDALLPSIVLWRSLLQWIGGGGIAVLSVAVLARLTEDGARLMRAELPGGSVTRLKPKIAQTAKSLYGVYLTITVFFFALFATALVVRLGMPFADAAWEAVNITFATVATGGFVPQSAGMGAYPDLLLHWIIIIGMILGGTSFTLLWFTVHGEPKRLLRDPEWRFFLTLIVAAASLITLILLYTRPGVWPNRVPVLEAFATGTAVDASQGAWAAFTSAVFTVTSLMTTTGFATHDFDLWPEAARIILLLLMFTGACAGSTTSALKLARTLLLFKVARREIVKLVNPNAYLPVRVGGAIVNEEAIRGIVAFFFAYIGLFLISTVFVALWGFDLFTSASMSAASIGNVGVGLGLAGPSFSLATLHPVLKGWLSFLMWVGRLEIFAALLLFVPSTYRR